MNEVVRGEAPESEDETLELKINRKGIVAAVITGEASESDEEEVYDKSSKADGDSTNNIDPLYNNNLLQRKLIENNLSMWRNLNLFVKNIITTSSKQLVSTDQLLIKSQNAMQSVLLTLDKAEVNIKQLHEKMDAVFTVNFIPNINLRKKL